MKLTNLLAKFKHKEVKEDYFFAIEISDDTIKSAVWSVVDGQTKIKTIGPTKTWDGQDQKTLTTGVDESISVASQNLKPEPSGVIFGLPESWMDKDNINPDKKNYLKIICESLALKPLGFVVTNTAVVQYLKIEEGSPPSAIFLQLSSTEINLSLVKLGKIIGNEIVGRSGDLGPDVEEGLSRFQQVDTLPSRMILYDGKNDFEEDRQQLISYDWEEKLPFIHFPKVESLLPEASIKAIALSGGSEVAKSLGFEIKETPEEFPAQAEPVAEDFGFSTKDVAQTEPISEPQPKQAVEPVVEKTPLIQLIKQKISLIKFPKIIIPGFNLIIIGFIILLAIVFSLYWFLPKARITLYFEPKTIQESFNITLDVNASAPDPLAAVLPAESLEISLEGNKSIATTGKKLTGTKASGDITIYNKTNQSKTFNQGTILVASNKLTFSLDENTTVASQSSQLEGTTFGKADAKITAVNIGSESNLAGDSQLSFKQFSDTDYSAKTSGLSGGSSQEVKAVAQKDQDDLLQSLTAELISRAQADLQSRLGSDKQAVEIKDQEKLVSKIFNYNVGEEAENLTLTAKLDYSTLSYSQADLLSLLNQVIKEKIPADFQLSASSETSLSASKLAADKTAAVTVDFKAKLIPKLDFESIKKQIKGRFPATTQDYFISLPSFLKADIVIKPNWPKTIKTLPHLTKNILIDVKTE